MGMRARGKSCGWRVANAHDCAADVCAGEFKRDAEGKVVLETDTFQDECLTECHRLLLAVSIPSPAAPRPPSGPAAPRTRRCDEHVLR